MIEKQGGTDGIDDSWPDAESPHQATGKPAPAGISDLPPPPAQLVAALTEFETAAPESFSAITAAATGAPAAATRTSDEQRPPRAAGWNRIPAHIATTSLGIVGIATGVIIMVGVVWALCAGRNSSPKEPSTAIAGSAAPLGVVTSGSEVPANGAGPSVANNGMPPPGIATTATEPPAPNGRTAQPSGKAEQVPARARPRNTAAPSPKKPCGKALKPCK